MRGLPEFGGEWPAAVLAEEIETPGAGQVRALVTSAGNPVLSTPNGARLERALATLDFMVSIDLYLNETTRHAHLILPPTFALERSHYDLVFHALAVRNTAKFSEPLFARSAGRRATTGRSCSSSRARIERARGEGGVRSWLTQRVLSALGPDGLVALLLRFGPRGAGFVPFGRGLTLGRLRRAPARDRPRPARAAPARAALHEDAPHRARPRAPAGGPEAPAARRSMRPRAAGSRSSAGASCAPTTPGCTTASGS